MTAGPEPLQAAQEPEVAAAVAELRAGKTEEAIARLLPLAGALTPSFDSLYWLGLAHAQAGDMDPAATFLGRAVAQRPQHAPALYNLGQVLLRLGRKEDGAGMLQRALQADPSHARARQALEQLGLAPPSAGPGQQRPTRAAPPGSVLCPQCGEANPKEYFSCRLCGRPADGQKPSPAPPPPAPAAASAYTSRAPEPEEIGKERTPEDEKRDLRVAAIAAGAVFGGSALLTAWQIAGRLGEAYGAMALAYAFLWLGLTALVPFIAALGVFVCTANIGTMRERFTAAAVIAAARVAVALLWTLVIDPLFGTILTFVPFLDMILSLVIVYLATITCIEKFLPTDLEMSHTVAWQVVVVTGVLGFIVRVAFPAVFVALMGAAFAGGAR